MSSSAQFYFEGATVSYPPVKPPWLRPVATAIVIAFHAFVAWITLVTSVPLFHPIDVTLVPSGSPLGLEEQEADNQPPEEVEQPELAMPAPMIMSPDAPVEWGGEGYVMRARLRAWITLVTSVRCSRDRCDAVRGRRARVGRTGGGDQRRARKSSSPIAKRVECRRKAR